MRIWWLCVCMFLCAVFLNCLSDIHSPSLSMYLSVSFSLTPFPPPFVSPTRLCRMACEHVHGIVQETHSAVALMMLLCWGLRGRGRGCTPAQTSAATSAWAWSTLHSARSRGRRRTGRARQQPTRIASPPRSASAHLPFCCL